MKLFSKIPGRFFSVLASGNKELYVQALFVLRQAFRTELVNAAENPEYIYQALQAAYQNTVRLVDELKSLFNNIRAYYRRIPGEDDVNILLAEHFDEYKEKEKILQVWHNIYAYAYIMHLKRTIYACCYRSCSK